MMLLAQLVKSHAESTAILVLMNRISSLVLGFNILLLAGMSSTLIIACIADDILWQTLMA